MEKGVKLGIVILGIVGCVAIGFGIKSLSSTENKVLSEDIKQGVAAIEELEKQDVLEIEAKIASIQSQYTTNNSDNTSNNINNQNTNSVDYKTKFKSSVILGDSRAETIGAYGLLNKSSLVAYKGRNIVSARKQGDISTAIGLYPKNIFLTYGINDVECYTVSDPFIKAYENVINDIKTSLPDANIYVCSILPVQSFAVEKQPMYKSIEPWNEELKALSEKMGVTYLDASGIVEASDYEPDGVHHVGKFQKKWLNFFIEKANL